MLAEVQLTVSGPRAGAGEGERISDSGPDDFEGEISGVNSLRAQGAREGEELSGVAGREP